MARKPGNDERQNDLFGAPAPGKPKAAPPRPASAPSKRAAARIVDPSPFDGEARHDDIQTRIDRLSPAELKELVAALPEQALTQLTFSAIRQLQRRLARGRSARSGYQASALQAAVRQLVAELGEAEEDYEF